MYSDVPGGSRASPSSISPPSLASKRRRIRPPGQSPSHCASTLPGGHNGATVEAVDGGNEISLPSSPAWLSSRPVLPLCS